MSFVCILLNCNILLYFLLTYSLISEANKTFRTNTFRTLNRGRVGERAPARRPCEKEREQKNGNQARRRRPCFHKRINDCVDSPPGDVSVFAVDDDRLLRFIRKIKINNKKMSRRGGGPFRTN